MKKGIFILLAVISIGTLSACGIKKAVQDKTQAVLAQLAVHPKAGYTEAADSVMKADGGGQSANGTDITPSGKKRPIAPLPEGAGYLERIENEWLNAPEVGYVWTITIHDVDEINVMGLCTATYNVNLSASHIGEDMFGAYFGEFDFDYSADMAGLSALLTLQGGSVDYDTDGWFKNQEFVFKLNPYDRLEEEMVESIVNGGSEYSEMSPEEQAYMEAILGNVYDLDNEKQFEKDSDAAAMWWSLDIPMTEGDLSGYFEMNGILGGIVDGKSEVDAAGRNVMAEARTAFGLYANGSMIYKFDERYSETDTIENPITYTIKVYPDNNVVMTIYSATGGPVTTKCYGTIDKIPVGQTTVVRP